MNQESGIMDGQKQQDGFSVLEVLVASALLILVISAVVIVSFGDQSALSDTQANSGALNKAQELLEWEQALGREDFNLVSPTSTPDGIYQKTVAVAQQADFFSKLVTVTVSWTGDRGRKEYTQLSALVTDFNNASGGDTCSSALSGDWSRPSIVNPTTSFASLIGSASGSYPLTALDAYKGRLYAAVGATTNKTDPTFFIFDISNPIYPQFLGKVDNNSSAATGGINAVATAGNYAYVANGYTGANFSTCVQGSNCAQLQIIDISNPASLSSASITNFKVPDVTAKSNYGYGNAVFYSNGYVYLGLASTDGNGPEFNIIDVHNPLQPLSAGGAYIGNGVNAIYVQGHYAYVASPNAKNLLVFDVSPAKLSADMQPLGNGFNASGGANGKSLKAMGDTVYLGRTFGSNEFYVLNAQDPSSITEFGSPPDSHMDLGVSNQTSINALVVRDYLAFLLTTGGQLLTYRVDNPTAIAANYAPALSMPSGSSGTALDCEGNYLYAASVDASNKGYLSVIAPGP